MNAAVQTQDYSQADIHELMVEAAQIAYQNTNEDLLYNLDSISISPLDLEVALQKVKVISI